MLCIKVGKRNKLEGFICLGDIPRPCTPHAPPPLPHPLLSVGRECVFCLFLTFE